MAPSTERDNKQRCRRNVFSSYHFHKLPQLNHLGSHIYNDPVTYCKFLRCYKDLGDINHELNEINKRIINRYTSIINKEKIEGVIKCRPFARNKTESEIGNYFIVHAASRPFRINLGF